MGTYINFHGEYKTKSYFEGWYLKHQTDDFMISFIPSFHIDDNGNKFAMIQVITEDKTYKLKYDITEFKTYKRTFYVKVGKCEFSSEGIILDIDTEDLKIKGGISYGEFSPLNYNIMGPFKYVPFMQCSHDVLSMHHSIKGNLNINGKVINFDGGRGYIEKDFGSSFPERYIWTQSGFDYGGNNSIMFSVADIPMLNYSFEGLIGVIHYKDREYRFATYLGAKVVYKTNDSLIVKQGKYKFYMKVLKFPNLDLDAPVSGKMDRVIKEGLKCKVNYKLIGPEKLIFDVINDNASVEWEF